MTPEELKKAKSGLKIRLWNAQCLREAAEDITDLRDDKELWNDARDAAKIAQGYKGALLDILTVTVGPEKAFKLVKSWEQEVER
jgi:hypothetical protein